MAKSGKRASKSKEFFIVRLPGYIRPLIESSRLANKRTIGGEVTLAIERYLELESKAKPELIPAKVGA